MLKYKWKILKELLETFSRNGSFEKCGVLSIPNANLTRFYLVHIVVMPSSLVATRVRHPKSKVDTPHLYIKVTAPHRNRGKRKIPFPAAITVASV